MTTYKILYWQEIPTQIKAEDEAEDVTVMLDGKFMAAAERCKPTIIGMSALLTTTMMYMKTVIDGFDAAGLTHIKMAIGGAPISQMFADEIGADGYGANASAAVDLFLRLAAQE